MQFVELLVRTGWEFVAVHRQQGDSTFIQCIEAEEGCPVVGIQAGESRVPFDML